jgi:long-chain acyl-CoA synthetase
MAGDSRPVDFFAGELLELSARRYPNKVALIAREETLTFSLLDERATNLARHLQREKVKPGDRVGIFLPNCIAFALSYFATQKAGVVTVVLDARLRGKELLRVLRDAALSLLITDSRLMAGIEEVRPELGQVSFWIIGGEGVESFESRFFPPPEPLIKPDLQSGEDALILYTSGTTGDPKGVVLSYANLGEYPRAMRELRITDAGTVRGCVLPMSHIVGPCVCNELADKGFTLVIFDQFNPVTLLEGIAKYRVSVFECVPPLFQLVLSVANLRDFDTQSLKIAAMMGTTVPLALLRAFKAAQPHVSVIQGYGLTETSPMITIVEPGNADAKMGSIGKPVPGVEVKVVGEQGDEVPAGEPGEIITRGPHVMKGYFRRPEATAERIRDGWLYTGDIGRRDSDGYYYHLGRKDDMIITGGLNVYPAEVENMLHEHPQVHEAVVFAIPDAKRGKVIAAAVVPREGQKVAVKKLLAYLRANLANFKVPQKIAVRDSLPRTSSGKVIRDPSVLLAE